MRRFSLIMVLAILICTACAKKPSPEMLAQANYGTYPDQYEAVIKQYMGSRLFDPYSAVYEFGTPYRGYHSKIPLVGGGVRGYGYFVQVGINAKNRFGGYTGRTEYVFLLNGNTIQGTCNWNPLVDSLICFP